MKISFGIALTGESMKRVYEFEKSNKIKKVILTLLGKKPKALDYEVCLINPMSQELYDVFPHHRIKKRLVKPDFEDA